MTRNDYLVTALLATISGCLLVPTLLQNDAFPFHFSIFSVLVFPLGFLLLEVVGLWVAGFLSRWLPFMRNLARYGATGVFNTLFDLCVLTSLAFVFGIYRGPTLAIFNVISFTATTSISYFINRHWSFAAAGTASPREFAGFMSVGATSLILNTLLVYTLTTHIGAPAHVSPAQSLSIAKLFGIIVSLLWNFTWFHFVIFRAKPDEHSALEIM